MTAKEQIGMEVRNVAQPIVYSVAKQNIMSLAKKIVPSLVKESFDSLDIPKKVPHNNPSLLVSSEGSKCLADNEVSIKAASYIPMDVLSSIQRMHQNMIFKNLVTKAMERQDFRLLKDNNEEDLRPSQYNKKKSSPFPQKTRPQPIY